MSERRRASIPYPKGAVTMLRRLKVSVLLTVSFPVRNDVTVLELELLD